MEVAGLNFLNDSIGVVASLSLLDNRSFGLTTTLMQVMGPTYMSQYIERVERM